MVTCYNGLELASVERGFAGQRPQERFERLSWGLYLLLGGIHTYTPLVDDSSIHTYGGENVRYCGIWGRTGDYSSK